MHDAGQDQRGYSLLELALVIILLGVVAFVVVPRFVGRSSFHMTGYYDQVASALDYARSVAVASGCPVEVDLRSGGFSVKQPGGGIPSGKLCPDPASGYTRNLPNPATGDAFGISTPSGVSFTSGTGSPLCFGANGQLLADCSRPGGATAAGDRTVTLSAPGGASLSITVYASTGYAARG